MTFTLHLALFSSNIIDIIIIISLSFNLISCVFQVGCVLVPAPAPGSPLALVFYYTRIFSD